MLFTAKRTFDLSSESENGFSVTLNSYLLTKYLINYKLKADDTNKPEMALRYAAEAVVGSSSM